MTFEPRLQTLCNGLSVAGVAFALLTSQSASAGAKPLESKPHVRSQPTPHQPRKEGGGHRAHEPRHGHRGSNSKGGGVSSGGGGSSAGSGNAGDGSGGSGSGGYNGYTGPGTPDPGSSDILNSCQPLVSGCSNVGDTDARPVDLPFNVDDGPNQGTLDLGDGGTAAWTGGFGSAGGPLTGTPALPEAPTSPVPEPGTWATLILGFGVLGTAIRRRRSPRLLSN